MVAYPHSARLILPIAPLGAGLAAAIALLSSALVPIEWLESAAVTTGLSQLVGAAQPPLGWTARAVIGLGAGTLMGAVTWSVLFLKVARRALVVGSPRAPSASDLAPTLRRADAHPDAPARRPLSAAVDLGPPFIELKVPPSEQPLPRDLDTPLAALDPDAIPAEPLTPVRAVEPLVRFATFPLDPPPPVETGYAPLLERLERSASRYRPKPRSATLEATLSSLRQMAARA